MFRVKKWSVRVTIEVRNLVVTGCWISRVTMTTRQSIVIYVVTYFTQTIVATEGIVTVMMTSTTSVLITLINIYARSPVLIQSVTMVTPTLCITICDITVVVTSSIVTWICLIVVCGKDK